MQLKIYPQKVDEREDIGDVVEDLVDGSVDEWEDIRVEPVTRLEASQVGRRHLGQYIDSFNIFWELTKRLRA